MSVAARYALLPDVEPKSMMSPQTCVHDSIERSRGWRALPIAILGCALALVPAGAHASVYAPNSPADVPDANPGNNVCETAPGNGVCTLRAAVQESNAHAGLDSITLQANTTYLLMRSGDENLALNGDLDISDSVTIAGAGPSTIVDGNGSVVLDRVFQVARCIAYAEAPDGSCINGNLVANISGITIQNGRRAQGNGGGILSSGILSISNITITNNQATQGGGGAIYNAAGGVVMLLESSISNNMSGDGGGIFGGASLTVSNSAVRENSAGVGVGGGIYLPSGTASIRASTISGNSSAAGGGIAVSSANQLTVVNSTISGNFSNGFGGGISSAGSVSLFNSTVTLNVANSDGEGTAMGGGVANGNGTFSLTNSIVTLNDLVGSTTPFFTIFADDCAGTISSQGNNIVSTVLSHCTVNGAYMQVGANLGPLQENGGQTQTHALIRPSAAIDAGNAAGCTDNLGAILTTDQRGFLRPEGGRCDIGAFEASDRVFGDGFET